MLNSQSLRRKPSRHDYSPRPSFRRRLFIITDDGRLMGDIRCFAGADVVIAGFTERKTFAIFAMLLPSTTPTSLHDATIHNGSTTAR